MNSPKNSTTRTSNYNNNNIKQHQQQHRVPVHCFLHLRLLQEIRTKIVEVRPRNGEDRVRRDPSPSVQNKLSEKKSITLINGYQASQNNFKENHSLILLKKPNLKKWIKYNYVSFILNDRLCLSFKWDQLKFIFIDLESSRKI